MTMSHNQVNTLFSRGMMIKNGMIYCALARLVGGRAPPYVGGEISHALEMRISKNTPPLPCELLSKLEFLQEIPQS